MNTLTINYAQIQPFITEAHNRNKTAQEIKDFANCLLDNNELIKEQISKKFTVKDLRQMVYSSSTDKKDYLVSTFFNRAIEMLHFSKNGISWSPMSETYEEALKRAIEAQTEETINSYLDEREREKEEQEKALNNPTTLSDFREFVQCKGFQALSFEQLKQFDFLASQRILEQQEQEKEQKNTVEKIGFNGFEFEIQEGFHEIKNIPLWVVTLSNRVERDQFKDLNSKAKRLGGYYSKFSKGRAIPGFQFTSKEDAENFTGLKEESKEKKERENMTPSKFLEMAENLKNKGEELNSQERRQNTHRQISQARGAEQKAEEMIFKAGYLTILANNMLNNKAVFLKNVKALSQLETLNSILNRAYYKRISAEQTPMDQQIKDIEKDIFFVKYPYPTINKERLLKIAELAENKDGFKLIGRRLKRTYNSFKPSVNLVAFNTEASRDDLKLCLNLLDRWEAETVKEELLKFERVQSLGLLNINMLRAALIELREVKKQVSALTPEQKAEKEIKELEREFKTKKIPGFFPTPENLIEEMLNFCNVKENEKVLEPSAGLGHIADQIKNNAPECDLKLIEYNYSLCEALNKKGHEAENEDFLQHSGNYDKIIMNPPFENKQDIQHVKHAFTLLNEGGKMSSIMSASVVNNEDFLIWLDSVNGWHKENEQGAFKSAFRSTGVNTVMIFIEK